MPALATAFSRTPMMSSRRRPTWRIHASRESPRRALDADPPQLGELVERRLTTESSVSAALDAAERHLGLVPDGLIPDVDQDGSACGDVPGVESALRERVAGLTEERESTTGAT